MVSKKPATSMIQKRASLPFSGKKPSRRRLMGTTLMAMAPNRPVMATVFFSRPAAQRAMAGGRIRADSTRSRWGRRQADQARVQSQHLAVVDQDEEVGVVQHAIPGTAATVSPARACCYMGYILCHSSSHRLRHFAPIAQVVTTPPTDESSR